MKTINSLLLAWAYDVFNDKEELIELLDYESVKIIIERDRKLVEALRAVVATYSGGGHRCAKEVARKALEEIGEG